MKPVQDAYIELVEAANNANTDLEHFQYVSKTEGFLRCLSIINPQWAGDLIIAGDMYYLNQNIERPMTGGIWHDWRATTQH